MATTSAPATAYGTSGTGPAGQGAVYVPVYSQAYGPYGNVAPPQPGQRDYIENDYITSDYIN